MLEHVFPVRNALQQFERLLKPGGIAITSVGNRYHPQNMLCEPHYGLPAMTILPRELAARYFSLSYKSSGNPIYDVFEWVIREELESLFESLNFTTIPHDLCEGENVLDELDDCIERLKGFEYPASISEEIFFEIEKVESLKKEVKNPNTFFGESNIVVCAKKCEQYQRYHSLTAG